jgi:hypothetical protein
MILIIRKILYFILGTLAILAGAMLFAICAYQLGTVRPMFYDRIWLMGLFAVVVVMGVRGIKTAMHLSTDSN